MRYVLHYTSSLTHPNFPKAALPEFDIEAERLPWDFPGVPRQALCLRLQSWTHIGEDVAQAVRMFCGEEGETVWEELAPPLESYGLCLYKPNTSSYTFKLMLVKEIFTIYVQNHIKS